MDLTSREFRSAGQSWWRKPLVVVGGRALPAELAILEDELESGEAGAWLNSRGRTSGCTNMVPNGQGFVEVKNPKWDRVSAEQARFHEVAREAGYAVAEWRFADDHTPAALD